jgi:hypothetical protein
MLSIEEKKSQDREEPQVGSGSRGSLPGEVGGFHGGFKRFFEKRPAELDWNVEYHKTREGIDDYGIPNIKPNLGIGIIAAAFGCGETPNDEADPWIKALISEDNLDDVHKLVMPDPAANPVYQRAWARAEFMKKNSPLPLRIVNVPSPLVTASLIWEYTSFIEALMIYPDEVHVLMDKITKATIAYVKEQFRRIDNLHSVSHEFWYVPRRRGAHLRRPPRPCCLRTCTAVRREVQQRDIPRLRRRVVHSCGDVQNVVAPMMEIDGLAGLDFTIPQNPNWEPRSGTPPPGRRPCTSGTSGGTTAPTRRLTWQSIRRAGGLLRPGRPVHPDFHENSRRRRGLGGTAAPAARPLTPRRGVRRGVPQPFVRPGRVRPRRAFSTSACRSRSFP